MTRKLLVIAGLGALTCFICLTIAHALGGPELDDANIGWWGGHERGPAVAGDGPQVTRTMAWTGGDSLTVNVVADVTYTQGPMAKMTVAGPSGAVNNLKLDDGRLTYDRRMRPAPRLKIDVTAPAVSEFNLNGVQKLTIGGYDQPALELNIRGVSRIVATGRTDRMDLAITGVGDADLGALAVGDADVKITGPGRATLAPHGAADIRITGPGSVILTTRPASLDSKVVGPGRIVQQTPSTAAAAS